MFHIEMNTAQPDSMVGTPCWDGRHGGQASERVDGDLRAPSPNSPEAPGDQDPGLVHLFFSGME